MSKGSKIRPAAITPAEYADRHEATFGKKEKEPTPAPRRES